jgi:hypothetical protein
MSTQKQSAASQLAHLLTADLWEELPGGDDQKAYWQNQFLGQLVIFDIIRKEQEWSGFKLVRQAWKTAFRFHSTNIPSCHHNPQETTHFCIAIVHRLLDMVRADQQIRDVNFDWFCILNSATYRASYHLN